MALKLRSEQIKYYFSIQNINHKLKTKAALKAALKIFDYELLFTCGSYCHS